MFIPVAALPLAAALRLDVRDKDQRPLLRASGWQWRERLTSAPAWEDQTLEAPGRLPSRPSTLRRTPCRASRCRALAANLQGKNERGYFGSSRPSLCANRFHEYAR